MVATGTKAQTKQTNILAVAGELFLERGYDAVSLDDILDRVGGSKTTLYTYYGGKEGLFAAMVERMVTDRLSVFLDIDPAKMEPKAGLATIGRRFLALVTDPEGRALYRMMITEADRFPALAENFYKAGPEALAREVKRNLDYWQKKGILKGGDTQTLSVQFIGLLLGNFSTRTLLGVGPAVTEKETNEWVARAVKLFLEGTLPR